MPLGRLTNLEVKKIDDEIKALREKIAYFNELLSNKAKLISVIKDEILEIKKKYSDERRTEIINVSGEMNVEDLIPNEKRVITFTQLGYLKVQEIETYKSQKRGGCGVSGMSRRENDIADEILISNTHDFLLFFTNFGKVYKIKCFEIPESSRQSKGMNIVNLIPLSENEKVTTLIKVSDFNDSKYLVMLTKRGFIKRLNLSDFESIRKSGLNAIHLDENDELKWVRVTDGNESILLATRNGLAVRFHEEKVRVMGRQARGVNALKLVDDDSIVNLVTAKDNDNILTISEAGYARISSASNYRMTSRGCKGVKNYRTEDYGKVSSILKVNINDDIIAISSDGTIIRFPASSVRQCSRTSKGVKVMRLRGDSVVVSVTSVERKDDDHSDIEENKSSVFTDESFVGGKEENNGDSVRNIKEDENFDVSSVSLDRGEEEEGNSINEEENNEI